MEILEIISLTTSVVTVIMGFVTKYKTTIANKRIPIQNLLIAFLSTFICFIFAKTGHLDMSIQVYSLACFGAVFSATGIYDITKAVMDAIEEIIAKK